MRVLLVDDDRDVAEYVRRELEHESLGVVVAHDGASGLRLAETSAFDIIVLDVMMPFMDGLQLTRNRDSRVVPQKRNEISLQDAYLCPRR
jgi:two-component system, OmpR family, response regulator